MLKLFRFFRRDVMPMTQTEDEWLDELTSRFSTLFRVTFCCPGCKQSQSVVQLQILGVNITNICQECVHCSKSIYHMKSGGKFIITDDQQVHRVFDFADEVEGMNVLHQTMVKKRLLSFESTFQKHAEICSSCRALNLWKMGDLKPKMCRRCRKNLSMNSHSHLCGKGVRGM